MFKLIAICLSNGSCFTVELAPCWTEDSINCYWDATTRGNGAGQSFADLDGQSYWIDNLTMNGE